MEVSEDDVTTPTADAGRRKSGRVVKAPEKFIPQGSSSQGGNAKRKRGDEEGAEEASDLEDQDGDEDMDSEGSGEEDAADEELKDKKRTKSAKSRAAKKPKVNGAQSTVKLPTRGRAPRKAAFIGRNAGALYSKLPALHCKVWANLK